MKTRRKFISLALAVFMAFGILTGCNCGRKGGDEKTVEIYAWESGYGIQWLKDIVKDFNESQTEYTATLEYNASADVIINTLDLGKANYYDLYFTMLQSSKYNSDFIDMTEILDSSPTGEEGKIRDKYRTGFIDGLKDKDGKERFMCYGYGNASIVYNRDLVSDDRVPNTTKELQTLVSELECTPWIFLHKGSINGYWNYLTDAWAAQYDGLDYYYNTLLKLKGATTPSKDILTKKDGRFKALEVLESIVTPNKVHSQSGSSDYANNQTLFLEGDAAMMPNGSWLLNESGKQANISMMKVPVISSIVDNCPSITGEGNTADKELSALIKAIDSGSTALSGEGYNVTQEDFDRVKEARNIMFNNATESFIFAPNYSIALEGVKEFLKFYHKDSSILRYNQATKLPAACKLNDASLYDLTDKSLWTKTMFKLADETIPLLYRLDRADVFLEQGNNTIINVNTAYDLIRENPSDRKDANGIWAGLIARVDELWNDWVKQ